ncbi:MAG TPA: putative 2-aminoethylphosphonate ABC transporter substrate-binding protein [Alphaproteobacteria bacterium]|jgi:iron(III) transport system substrate-binding protein|nr:putative 2-aminoethylphosphonate ABC transporter substrate-binding protein [Alphaproteobacteria bacterium]
MTISTWTRRSLGAVALGAAAFLTAPAFAEELTVYTAIEADQLQGYKEAFEADNPDITINWVRDSTGIITAKLLAEKSNPQADVVWGLAATSLQLLDGEGMLDPYAPAGLEKLSPKFRDKSDPPAWVGMDAWGAVICFNTVEAEKQSLPKPESWADLTKPEYAGKVVMPNPSSSGTGYLMVSSWLQMMGEEKGWQYLDALHNNAAVYTHSGSKPCKMAAAGEYPIGLSFEYRAAKSKAEGAPIDIVFPKEGLGWDMEATGIMKGTKKLDAAKKLVDWSISQKANEMYAKGYAVVALPGAAQKLEYIPENYEEMLIDNDFDWAAKQRESILAEWSKRYDAKSEPKS